MKNLFETGLEIAGCMHAITQKAANMMYGEIYSHLKEPHAPVNVLTVWQEEILHAAQGEIPVPENRFLRNILILTGVALLFFQ